MSGITYNDAINLILSSIGADPVNAVNAEIDVDVANAVRMLDKVSRDVQRKGWDYNTYNLTLEPEVNTHKIAWIDSILSIISASGRYVKRGSYFWDMDRMSSDFEGAITIEAVLAQEYDDLPDCFRNYIANKAALDFQARYLGDAQVAQDLSYAVAESYQDIVAYDLNTARPNMLRMAGTMSILER